MNRAGRPARSVSVVIPTYNRASLLPQTLDAILAQTAPADEIIVVDDGSTDGTVAAVEGYGPGVRVLRQANAGDLVARNTGLAEAVSDLVAFCDSDDLWKPEFLATMHRVWDAEPATTAAFANFQIVRDGIWQTADKFSDAPTGFWDGWRPVAGDLALFDTAVTSRLIDFQPFFPSAMVANKAWLASVGGWDAAAGRRVGCDFSTILRIGDHPPIGVAQASLVGIRKHAGNHSADTEAMNLGDAMILEHVLATRPWLDHLTAPIAASVARRRLDALDSAFARGDLQAVRDIAALLPAGAGGIRQQIKLAVARLPSPLGQLTASALAALRRHGQSLPG